MDKRRIAYSIMNNDNLLRAHSHDNTYARLILSGVCIEVLKNGPLAIPLTLSYAYT